MEKLAAISGIVIILAILLDAFETVVLPRRVTRHFRLTAWFYRGTWIPWAKIARQIKSQSRKEAMLGYFGPLSLIFLLALWAAGLISGFALLQFGAGEHLQLNNEPVNFGRLLYHSGETFFTLGYGDIVPTTPLARALAVLEAGMGFGFLALVIGYLPTIYSAFSRREVEISLLDARAGSPPTAAELLSRFGNNSQQEVLDRILSDWEHWAAEVLESHLSYGVLSFFRSQHVNQSWVGALTTILDTTALIMAGVDGLRDEQARLTFAMARHAVVDLAQVTRARYNPHESSRLPESELRRLQQMLASRGIGMRDGAEVEEKLSELRALYEPYATALATRLFITLPGWMPRENSRDNWQTGPWDRIIQARGLGAITARTDDHF